MKKTNEIDPSKPLFHWCPRFEKCSANRCPFAAGPDGPLARRDPEIGAKKRLRGEEKCGLAKSRRMRLWESLSEEKKSLLPYRGMFKREFSARQRWENLPEEEKAKRTARLVKIQKRDFIPANQEESEK